MDRFDDDPVLDLIGEQSGHGRSAGEIQGNALQGKVQQGFEAQKVAIVRACKYCGAVIGLKWVMIAIEEDGTLHRTRCHNQRIR